MHLETLKVFCDLAETKSFSKAAEVNGITQSAVSQQVRALETKYEVSLVERNRKACGLTPEGRTFLDAARRIVEAYRAIGDQLRSSSGRVAGRIRIASEFSIGLHELPPALTRFRGTHSQVEVAVKYMRSPEIYDAVAAGEFDLGLVAYPQVRPGLKSEIFDEDELVLICHPDHPLARCASIEPATLSKEYIIAYRPDAPTNRAIERQLRNHNAEFTPAMQFDNIETVKRAVEINSGISLVPRNTVQAEVADGRLVEIPLEGARFARPLAVVYKNARSHSPAIRAFSATLRGEAEIETLTAC
jgi:DNA-binding transcriptional LysR family regulator